MKLDGVGAIVTGGASGLGAATAEHLAAKGARVTILDRDESLGRPKAAQIKGHFIATDVVDEAGVESAIAEAHARHGVARILVNCAGIGVPTKILDREGKALPLSAFSKTINVNLVGTFNVLSKFAASVHAAEPIGEERAVIINTASVAAFDGQIGQAAYSASKGGLVGLGLPAAREFARYRIRVMTIAPGIFLTPAVAALPQAAQDSLGQQVPFPNRMGQPEEFALLVESIIVNPMLNGEVIRLDGAIRMAAR